MLFISEDLPVFGNPTIPTVIAVLIPSLLE